MVTSQPAISNDTNLISIVIDLKHLIWKIFHSHYDTDLEIS